MPATYQQVADLVRPSSAALADMLLGPSADVALAALGRALKDDDQAALDDVAAALATGGDPDAASKVRGAEQQLLKDLSDAGASTATLERSEERRLALYDELSSRADDDRQRAREHQRLTHDNTNRWLAIGVTVGFFGILTLVIAGPLWWDNFSLDDNPVAQTLLGVMGTGWIAVISYYFGSSIGSKEKTALLDETVTATARRQPPVS